MALVKKFKGGGTFTDYLKQELHRDSHASNVSFDELIKESETYAPDENEAAESNSRSRRNRNRNTNRELLNQYYKKYQDNVSNMETIKFNPTNSYQISDLSDHISKQYGGNAQYAHEQLRKLYGDEDNPSNEGVKNKLREYMTELSSEYINKSAGDPEGKWDKLEEVKALNALTSNGLDLDDDSWAKMVGMSSGIGWDVTPYLLSDDDIVSMKDNHAIRQAEEKAKATTEESNTFLKGHGIGDETLINSLRDSGFTSEYGGTPDSLKAKGFRILENSLGERVVLKDGKIFADDHIGLVTKDQFDTENYGDIYRISGGKYSRERYDPAQEYAGLELDFDDLGSNVFGITGEVDGNSDLNIQGSSLRKDRTTAYDIFGNRDYTTKLDIRNNQTGDYTTVYKQPNGKYETAKGIPYNNKIILKTLREKWGADNKLPEDFLGLEGWVDAKEFDPAKGLKGDPYVEIEKKLADWTKAASASDANYKNLNVKSTDLEKYRGYIKHQINKAGNNQDELAKWSKLWDEMHTLLHTEDAEGNKLLSIIDVKKDGGKLIPKHKEGSAFDNILSEKYQSARVAPASNDKPKGIKRIQDTKGTMRDMDALGAISLAGTAISFIPGVGVIGGAASTVADAIKGAQDGWDGEDWGNLASNIAFTGLSFFGLGGAKALAKGAQAASKVAKVGKAAKATKAATKTSKALDSLGDAGKALKELPFSADGTWVTRAGQYAKGVAQKASPMVGKTIKTGAAVGTYGGGALGAIELGSNIAEDGLSEGFLNTDQSAIRRITQAGALGRAHAVNHLNAKATNKFTELKGAKASTFKINDGDKTRTFEGKQADKLQELLGEKKFGTGKGFKSKLTRGYSEDTLDQASKIMAGDDQNSAKAIREALNNLKKSGNISYTPTSGGTRVLITNPEITSDRDMRDYIRASKTMRRENPLYSRWGYRKMAEADASTSPEPTPKAAVKKPSTAGTGKYKSKTTVTTLPKHGYGKTLREASAGKPIKATKYSELDSTTKDKLMKDFTKNNSKRVGKAVRTEKEFQSHITSMLKKLSDGSAKMEKGGILKMQQGTTKLGFTNPYLATSDPRTKTYSLRPEGLGMKRAKSLLPTRLEPMKFDPINLRGQNTPTATTVKPDPESITVRNTNPINWNPKQYKDTYLVAEGIKAAAVNQANSRITDNQIKGVSQIAKRSYMPSQHFRKNLDASVMAETQASELASGAGRLGRTTSDTNQRLGIQLEGARHASDTRLAGRMQDIDRNRQIDDMQRQSNAQTQQYNLGVDDQNRATAANARRETYGLVANKHTMDVNNTQNFISTLSNYAEQRPERKLRHDYLEALNNPNITKAENLLAGTTKEKQLFMDKYDSYYRNKADFQTIPSFEDSDFGKQWKLREQEITDFYKNSTGALGRYNKSFSFLNPPVKSKKKGGRLTVEERKYLKDVDYEHKRKIKDQELFFKTILENNKLAQKALLKVFK